MCLYGSGAAFYNIIAIAAKGGRFFCIGIGEYGNYFAVIVFMVGINVFNGGFPFFNCIVVSIVARGNIVVCLLMNRRMIGG